jgi:uncharacterized protein
LKILFLSAGETSFIPDVYGNNDVNTIVINGESAIMLCHRDYCSYTDKDQFVNFSSNRKAKEVAVMKSYDWVAFTLPVIGGINWGLIGLTNFNLVSKVFGDRSRTSKVVYGLVGISAVYLAIVGLSKLNRCDKIMETQERMEEARSTMITEPEPSPALI